MIATQLPRSWRAVRIGQVQPMSAIVPALLRHYGLQLPPKAVHLADVDACDPCDRDENSVLGFDDSRVAE